MLRNRSSRLNRRKLTSSVHSKYEPIDPEVAREHAHKAAMLAFHRGQARKSQTDVSCSASSARRPPNPQQELMGQGPTAPAVRRQQSVRFVGPRATLRAEPLPHARSAHVADKNASIHLQPMAMTTNAPVPAAYRPPSRTSSIGKGSIGKASTKRLLMVNDAFDEQYTREDDVASTPSSYRRIRRSKSLLSASKAPSIYYNNGTPGTNIPPLPHKRSFLSTTRRSQDDDTETVLRAPKSMSFLRGRSERDRRMSSERNDEAIQMARDRFFTQSAQQRLREQPSFLFRARAQRQERSFRKSVRSGSGTQGFDMPISSTGIGPVHERSIKDAARKASRSLRSKLKRVFGRSSKDDSPVEVPNQQVVAKETHVRRHLGELPTDQSQYQNSSHHLAPSLWQVNSRVPSLHTVASNQQLRSHNGSVRSARSIKSVATDRSDDKSRVTSWTSTGINTLNSHTAHHFADKETQRLSVIKENGTHIPSSSFRPAKHQEKHPSHTQASYRGKENFLTVPQINSAPIDSARMYSALMKRIDANDRPADLRHESTAKGRQAEALHSGQKVRKSRSQATIRRVTSDDQAYYDANEDALVAGQDSVENYPIMTTSSVPLANNYISARSALVPDVFRDPSNDVFSFPASVPNKENIPPPGPAPSLKSGLSRQTSTKTLYHTDAEKNMLTPQEMANRNEHSLNGSAPRMLRDSRSTFFGATSTVTVSRTPSPFRKVLNADFRVGRSNEQKHVPRRLSPLRNPLYLASSSGASNNSNADPDVAYSESVYSRTTSGQIPGPSASPIDFNFGEPDPLDPSTGDAVIIGRATYRPSIPLRKQHKVSTSTASVDWQKWMSSEVAKLERPREGLATVPHVNCAMPTMPKSSMADQIRKEMQTSDGDTDSDVDVVRKPVARVPSGATVSLIHGNTYPRSILKTRSASSLVEGVSEDSRQVSASRSAFPPPPPPPPPLPLASRLPLRQMQPKMSAGTLNTPVPHTTASAPTSTVKSPSLSGRNVLHKRNNSTTTLRSTKSDIPSNKLVRRPRQSRSRSPNRGPIVGISLQRDNFGSTSSRGHSPSRSGGASLRRQIQDVDDEYHTEGAGLMGPMMYSGVGELTEREAQSMGSKKMVDMFLSSRRRRIASASDDGGVGRAFI